ncbi:MAG TPA: transaldolase [Candidatus Macondimonas sp.]|nr:transaldolase [Candidatus Macondimonas sp.]
MNQLEQLRAYTTVVADTGDIEAIARYRPTDATTNPSLILAAAGQAAYQHLMDDAVRFGERQSGTAAQRLDAAMDKLAVNFGVEILRIVPGRVSTEVDARLSFDVAASLAKARRLIALYEAAGVDRARVLIKLASTWEGIETARVLEREGIHSNMTLLFCLAQAAACAEAGVRLISPFVGRITDWYRQHEGVAAYAPERDPGVRSVTTIFNYFKKFGYETQIMGASFRHVGQVTALAGCDLLTIAPTLLAELESCTDPLPRRLDPAGAAAAGLERLDVSESRFRWMLNEDAMATEKLAEGIRRFAVDAVKLEGLIAQRTG